MTQGLGFSISTTKGKDPTGEGQTIRDLFSVFGDCLVLDLSLVFGNPPHTSLG